ncbi:MAG TPA: DUF2207 domain-containing protein, partial [bacterium]|nr:DUF2207 domain-containing protein [bacterium]
MKSTFRFCLLIFVIAILTAVIPASRAGTGSIEFVETNVQLYEDGRALVEYLVRWRVLSGEFHGFYFSGYDRLIPVFDLDNAWAVTDSGQKYRLEIKRYKRDTFDIILADGQGVSSGTVTYRFRFLCEMDDAGYLAPTTTDDGRDLVVFNWAPTQWDQRLDHYTVWITYPLEHRGGSRREDVERTLLEHGFATEKFMNREYLIDYKTVKSNGKNLVQIQLHKDNPPARYHFRIQQYVDADLFSGLNRSAAAEPAARPGSREERNRMILMVVLSLIGSTGIFTAAGKHRSMIRAQAGVDDVTWLRSDWEPPKLEIASYRKDGKIARELDPIEAAVFIGVPYKQIFSTILAQLIAREMLKLETKDPLVVSVPETLPTPLANLGAYERLMFQAARDDGRFSESELTDLMQTIVDNTQQKTWDCDIEATRKYWHEQIALAFMDEEGSGDRSGARHPHDPVNGWWYYYHYHYGYHTRFDRYAYDQSFDRSLPVNPDNITFQEFAAGSPAAGLEACHAACHNACHN